MKAIDLNGETLVFDEIPSYFPQMYPNTVGYNNRTEKQLKEDGWYDVEIEKEVVSKDYDALVKDRLSKLILWSLGSAMDKMDMDYASLIDLQEEYEDKYCEVTDECLHEYSYELIIDSMSSLSDDDIKEVLASNMIVPSEDREENIKTIIVSKYENYKKLLKLNKEITRRFRNKTTQYIKDNNTAKLDALLALTSDTTHKLDELEVSRLIEELKNI